MAKLALALCALATLAIASLAVAHAASVRDFDLELLFHDVWAWGICNGRLGAPQKKGAGGTRGGPPGPCTLPVRVRILLALKKLS